VDLLCEVGLASSKSQARRLVTQGGAYVNDQRLTDVDRMVTADDLVQGQVMLRAGKKKYHRIVPGEKPRY